MSSAVLRRASALTVTTAALVALAACGGGDSESTADAPQPAPGAPTTSTAASSWKSDLMVHGVDDEPWLRQFGSTLVVWVDRTSTTVAVAKDGAAARPTGQSSGTVELAAVQATTGETLWTAELPMPDGATTTSSPALMAGTAGGTPVLLAAYDLEVPSSGLTQGGSQHHAAVFDVATGEVRWDHEVPGLLTGVDAAAVTASGSTQTTAVFQEEDELFSGPAPVTGIDLATGDQAWEFAPPGKGTVYATGGSVVLQTGTLMDNQLIALDATTGAQRWATPLTNPSGLSGHDTWDVQVAGGGAILAVRATSDPINGAKYTGMLLDAASGTPVDQKDLVPNDGDGGSGDPALADDGSAGYLFTDGQLVAFNAAGGWAIDVPKLPGGGKQAIVSATSQKIVVDSAGLVTLDPATGKQVGQTEPTGGTGAKQPLLTVEGWDVHWDGRQLTGEKA